MLNESTKKKIINGEKTCARFRKYINFNFSYIKRNESLKVKVITSRAPTKAEAQVFWQLRVPFNQLLGLIIKYVI